MLQFLYGIQELKDYFHLFIINSFGVYFYQFFISISYMIYPFILFLTLNIIMNLTVNINRECYLPPY